MMAMASSGQPAAASRTLASKIRRHSAIADLVGIAESIELEQFGRDGDAAGMSLAALAVDVYSQ
jgi:predicted transcriptional regulator